MSVVATVANLSYCWVLYIANVVLFSVTSWVGVAVRVTIRVSVSVSVGTA